MGDFVFNVKGLTAADRAQWEKDNLEKLKGTNYFNWSEEDKTRAFSDASFTNKYKNRQDFNELRSLSPEQRDSIFNLDLKPEDTIDNAVESTDEYNNTVERLNKWHKEGEKAIKDLDDLAKSLNPYYERYLGTDYLPWSEEDKIKAYAKYQQNLSSFGKDIADKELSNDITRTIANNQHWTDTYLRGFNNFGASLIGATLSSLGFMAGLIASPVYMAMEEDNGPTKDLNAFESYLHYVVNNKMTDYGDRIIKRGTLDPRVLTSDDPKDDWNINEIIHTPEEEESNWDYVFSRRLIPELMGTAGFTTAAILEGKVLSAAGKMMSGWRTTSALSKVKDVESAKVALEQIKNIAKWERRFNAYAIPTLIGTGEGVINALDTYNTTLNDGERLVNDVIYDKVQTIKQSLLENPEMMGELGYSNLSELELELQIMQSLTPEREDMLRKNREEAAEAELLNLGLNSVINGGINVLLKSPMFGGRVKEAVTRSIGNTKVGKFFNSNKPSFTYNNGTVEAVLPSTLNRVGKATLEMFGEAGEEYLQEISDKAAQGAAEYSMDNFIARRLNGDAYEAIQDDFTNVAGAALYAAGEAAVSKEAIRSALMGGFSQALGTATINTQAFHDMKNAKTRKEKIGHLFRAFYRNPFIEELREAKIDRDVKTRTAKNIEDWLKSDNNLERFTSMAGAASWIREMNEHNESGDEFSYKNSKFGKLINDVFMLNDLKGTDLYDSYIQQYLDIINAETGTEEANTIEKESGMSLEDAKKHAQSMLDNIENVNKGLEELEGILGKNIDSEVKKALVYGKLSYNDWEQRGKTLEEEITQGDTITSEDSRLIDSAFKYQINRFKIKELKKELDKIKNEINTAEKNEKHLSKKQKAELKNKKSQYKKLNEQYNNLNENIEDNKVITSRGLLFLNPIDRYRMLNPKNRRFFTEEQLKYIDELVNNKQLEDANFMQKVEDSARIEEAKELYLNQYINALKDPSNLNKLATILRTNIAVEQLKSKYKYLNDINNKEEFLKELDKAFDEAKDTLSKQFIIDTVANNPFYKEIIESEEETKDFDVKKESNALYRSLEDKSKRQIEAVEAFLESKKISPKSLESLEAITNNNGNDLLAFIEEFNKNNPDNQIEFDNIGEIIANYQALVDDLIREEKQEEEVNKPSQRKETPIKETKVPEEQSIEGTPEVTSKTERLTNPILDSLEELPEYKDGIQEVRDFISSLDSNLDSKAISEALNNHDFSNVQAHLISAKIVQILQGNKFAIAEQERRIKEQAEKANESGAVIDVLVLNSFKGQPGFEALERFYNIYDIDDFLKSNVISRKDGIFFIYDPALASQVSSNMGDSYTIDDAPIILAIQSNEGNYEVDGIRYQPIGVYRGKDNNKKDLLDSVKGNTKQIIKQNGKPIVTTIFKYIQTKAPQHIKQGELNIPIGTVAFNDESNATKEKYNQSSKEEKGIFYINLRERILSKIKYIGKDENPKNPTPHLAYTDTDNKVGGEAQIDIFISDPEDTVNRDGKAFRDVLLEGNPNELFTYNSRLYGIEDTFGLRPKGLGLVNAIREFFNNKPFDKLSKGKTLKDINEELNNIISNYITLSNREYYRLELVPTGNIVNEVDEYELRLIGPSKLVTDTAGNTSKQDYNYLLGTINKVTLNDDTLVKIVQNLFLDENNNFRKVSYKGKEESLIKWNVNYDSFERGKNDKSSGARKHREEIYDDNILTVSKTSLKRIVTGLQVNTPNVETSRPKNIEISNKDNANTNNESNNTNNGKVDVETGIVDEGKPEKIDDNIESDTELIVKRIKEQAKQLSRTTDEKFYTDGTNNYIRATSIIREEPYASFDYEIPSAAIGNSVDLFVRDFFNNSLKNLEEYPNATKLDWDILLAKLHDFKMSLERDGFKVISEIEYPDGTKDGIRTKGNVEVIDDKGETHSVKVAGTLDLLAYNPTTGKFRIYDMKTLRNEKNVSNQDYINKWGKQLLLYKKFLEEEYGIEIESTQIIPIKVSYPKASYEVTNNQLSINGIEYKGAEPKMLDIVNIDTSKINFKVKFNVLSIEEQQLILGEIPQGTKPVELREPERKTTPIKKRGKLNIPSKRDKNISKDFKIPEDSYKEGTTSLEISEYSFDKLKEILTEDEYKALEDRFTNSLGIELTKESWEDIPQKIRESNIKCVRGK